MERQRFFMVIGDTRREDFAPMKETTVTAPAFIQVPEVARLISLPVQTVRRLIREGVIPAYRIGTKYLCRPEEVIAAITANKSAKHLDMPGRIASIVSPERAPGN